ncbi:MAG: electron transport complex subunit RsxC [Clostridiales bacterium]|nr:electron transport complex subunit RsxC [Clostridiales bacterium]
MKTFPGGFHVPDNKELTASASIEQMPLVAEYFVSLSQHIGRPAEPVVAAGDVVIEGQLIAKASSFVSANIHSPVCGEIVGVVKRRNAQGATVDYIHIKPNGKQDKATLKPLVDPTPAEIIERVAEAGIVGMGGAGFPTAVKLQPQDPVDTLIINAAECEPYLNCDNRLMIERAEEFIQGVRLIAKAINVSNVYIGLEANKMEAYDTLTALDGVVGDRTKEDLASKKDGDIVVVLLKKKYPQGAEKTIIKACVNRKVPVGALPAAVGCIVDNVGTAYAVYDAVVNGRPLYKRLMTVSGRGINTPKNIEVNIGTPLSAIVEFCDNLTDGTVKLVSGGPMMGFTLQNLDVATTKTDSGLLALTDKEASTVLPTPCINCGKCASVCPMKLMPMYIDFYATCGDTENAVKYGAANCFECGTCAYVCPAKRPIVQSVRLTKMKMKEKK